MPDWWATACPTGGPQHARLMHKAFILGLALFLAGPASRDARSFPRMISGRNTLQEHDAGPDHMVSAPHVLEVFLAVPARLALKLINVGQWLCADGHGDVCMPLAPRWYFRSYLSWRGKVCCLRPCPTGQHSTVSPDFSQSASERGGNSPSPVPSVPPGILR